MGDWPRTDTCGGCGEEILAARGAHQGHPFKLDPLPVLPEGPCGVCRGTGRATFRTQRLGGGFDTLGAGDLDGRMTSAIDTCLACNGSGLRGEELADLHVLVDSDTGIARRFDGDARNWEAAHRRHRCPQPAYPDRADEMIETAAQLRRDGFDWPVIAKQLDTAPGLIARAVAERHPDLHDAAWPEIQPAANFPDALDRVTRAA